MSSTVTENIRLHKLANGLTLVYEPMPWLRSLSMSVLLPVGSINDPVGEEGSANVLSEWLGRGAGELGSREFNDRLEGLGVRRGGGAGREAMSVSASMLAQELPNAFPLLADMLRRPQLSDDQFASSRELAIQELASLDDSPGQKLGEALNAHFFSSAHGRSPYGTMEGLAGLTPDSVRADFERRFTPQGTIIAAAGGDEWERLVELTEAHFSDWQGEPAASEPARIGEPGRFHVEEDASQVQIGIAFPSLEPTHPDWYKHSIALGVLSSGMGSRLFSEVREKRGLVYMVFAAARAVRGFGYVIGRAGTTPEKATETIDVMLAEFNRLREGVSEAELERSKTGSLSQLVMQGESSGARASALTTDMLLRGAPRSLDEAREQVARLTLGDVNGYLGSLPAPEPLIVTLGKGEGFQ